MTRLSVLLGPPLSPEMTPDRMGCRQPDVDPDLFFDDTATGRHEARTVCVIRCTVRASCLAWITEVERGKGRTARVGICAGLESSERWDMDPTAPGERRRQPLPDDPECGTATALLRHLQHGEDVDPECWSGEERRALLRVKVARRRQTEPEPAAVDQLVGEPAEPVIEAALAAAVEEEPAPAPACPRPECRIRTPHGHRTRPPAPAAEPEHEVLPAPAVHPEAEVLPAPAAEPDQTVQAPVAAPFTPASPQDDAPPTTDLPECGTEEAFVRHKQLGEIVDPLCWNAAGRRRQRQRHSAVREAS